jgi:HD-GYP domain-containing protein (c-di-GMP phosphodiesterase class II)
MSLITHLRSTLTYPIAATLVLVTVVPVALVGFLLSRYNREHITTEEKRLLTRQATSLASEISLFFGGHRTQLESTARALEAGGEIGAQAFEALLQDMAAEPDRAFIYLQILNSDGEGTYVRSQALDSSITEPLEEAIASAHESALSGDRMEELFADLPRPQVAKVVLALPLRSRGGLTWGSLIGVLDFQPLADRLQEYTNAGFLVSMFDEQGTAVLSSDPRLKRSDLAASPLVADFLGRPLRLTSTYSHPMPAIAGEVLGSVAPVQGLDWGVLVERPTALAFAPVRTMQQRTLAVSAVTALFALALGFALSRRLIVPLQNLATTSSDIAEGNFAARSAIKGLDEIAQLAGNFNHMAGSIENLVRRLRQALRQNQELFLETIRTLAAAIDAKDQYTRGHSERVSSYSLAIARHLGLSQEEVFRVRIASILHDVGKLGIRDGILNKPGGLTDEEFAVMRQHPGIGAQIMAPIRMLKDIIPGIRNHHETWDGKGYPDRLTGEQIPLVARIIGAADTFDAMTTTRPYQQAMELDYVLEKMQAMSGSRFDPKVVEALLAAVNAGDVTPPRGVVEPEQESSQEVS